MSRIDFRNYPPIKPLIKGLLTFIPGMAKILPQHKPGEADSAAYCYEVWLKHLTFLWAGGHHQMPVTLTELGPGGSLGIGLAALLSGVNRYYALDIIKYSDSATNLKILDELMAFFKHRAARPEKGWPDYDPYLDHNFFPSHILTEKQLNIALADERIEIIRRALIHSDAPEKGISIKYIVPWTDISAIKAESVDMIISHAVMEHVQDLERTYRILFSWLKPDGMMSHQIDFSAHGFAKAWNGHLAYSEKLWNAMMGKRDFFLNRQPCTKHIDLIQKQNFEVVTLLKKRRHNGLTRDQLSTRWQHFSSDDLTCEAAFIQARKPKR